MRDPWGGLVAAGLCLAFSGSAALRLDGQEDIAPMMTGVYAISGLTLGFLVAAGGRVPRAAVGAPMPTLPVSGADRALANVILGALVVTPGLLLGNWVVEGTAVVPAGPHLLTMALLVLPGLLYGPRADERLFLRANVLAFFTMTLVAAWARALTTPAGAAVWALAAAGCLALPPRTLTVPRWRGVGSLGHAGTSVGLAVARLEVGGALAPSLLVGTVLALTPLLVRGVGLGDGGRLDVLVLAFAAAVLPAWPVGWPRPYGGHAAVLARLPVSRGVALVGIAVGGLATVSAVAVGFFVTWWAVARPAGVVLEAAPGRGLAMAVGIGILVRLVVARALFERRAIA